MQQSKKWRTKTLDLKYGFHKSPIFKEQHPLDGKKWHPVDVPGRCPQSPPSSFLWSMYVHTLQLRTPKAVFQELRDSISSVLHCHQTLFPTHSGCCWHWTEQWHTPKDPARPHKLPVRHQSWYVGFGAQVLQTEEPKQLNPGGCSSAVTESSWYLAAHTPFPSAVYQFPALDLFFFLR